MKKIILFFVLFIPLMLLGQENKNSFKYTIHSADSLSDTGKYKQSNKMLIDYLHSKNETSRKKAELYSAIIDNYNSYNIIDSSKIYLKKFEKIVLGENLTLLKSRLFFYRGMTEFFSNNLQEGLQFFLISLDIAKLNNQKNEEIQNQIAIGRLLFTNRNNNEAKKYLEKAFENSKKYKNKTLKVKAALLLSECYSEEKKYNEAINLVKSVKKDITKNTDLFIFYGLMSKIYLAKGNHMYSFQYAQKALELGGEIEFMDNLKQVISQTKKITLSPDSLVLKNLEKYEKGIEKKIEHDLGKLQYQKALLTANQQDENIVEELKQLKKTLKLKDSIYSIEKEKVVTELETKYRTKEKELTIEKEKKRKQEYAGIAILTLLSLLFFIYYAYTRKKRIEHKNKLSLIQVEYKNKLALVTTKQEAHNEIGIELHDKKAKDLERIAMKLEKKGDVILASEIKEIKDTIRHLSSELRFISFEESSFVDQLITLGTDYSNETRKIKLSGLKDIDWSLIPDSIKRNLFLVIREGVSNATTHSKASVINISCKKTSKQIEVSVVDNGIGFDQERVVSGSGMRNMKMRIQELDGTIQFKSILQKGTSINITITTA